MIEGARLANREEQWHLDKKVPITIIGAMLFQAAIAVWFASKLDTRVAVIEDKLIEQTTINKRQDTEVHAIDNRLARMEERQISTLELLKDLKAEITKTEINRSK